MASVDTLSTDYRTITEACGLLDRSERGKLALTGADAASFLQGQVSNDIEGLVVGAGCYAAFLTPKGKMLGDVRVLNAGDELLLDTERVALQALFNMIRRFSLGYDVELHKRTLGEWAAVADRPRRACVAGAAVSARMSTPTSPPASAASRRGRSARTWASTCSAMQPSSTRCGRRLEQAGAVPVAEAAVGMPAGRARAPTLRDRPRRVGHPAGSRAQRARGVVHQGLLRRSGDRGAPVLPRQAQPAAAGAAAVGGGASSGEELVFDGRMVGRVGQRGSVTAVRPDRAWRWSAARRRRARRSPSGRREVVEPARSAQSCRFARAAPRVERRAAGCRGASQVRGDDP